MVKEEKIKELKQKIHDLEFKIADHNTIQLALKVLMNALYGATGTNVFRYYDRRISESITTTGQLMNRLVEHNVNKMMNEKLGTNDFDYVVTMDTDSILGDSLIYVNDKQISIEDYFDSLDTTINSISDMIEYKYPENDNTLSFSDIIENKKIKYIKKANINKRMFKIKTKNKEVVVTEDHSIIVKRNEEMISVKPNDIEKTDLLVEIVN